MISINEVTPSCKKEVESFKKIEWSLSDKEKEFEYNKKTYERIAIDKERIAGYTKYELLGGTAFLREIIVAKNARKQGIGKMLLEEFEKRAKKEGCHRCFLETSKKHREALKFYKKEKYKIIAKLKNHKFYVMWYIFSKELT